MQPDKSPQLITKISVFALISTVTLMNLMEAIKYFEKQDIYFKHIIEMGSVFSQLEKSQWNDAIARFHDDAGRMENVLDYDFGAIVLESEADNATSSDLKLFLLHHALMRAEWYTQAATAGSELIARGKHVELINDILSKCT